MDEKAIRKRGLELGMTEGEIAQLISELKGEQAEDLFEQLGVEAIEEPLEIQQEEPFIPSQELAMPTAEEEVVVEDVQEQDVVIDEEPMSLQEDGKIDPVIQAYATLGAEEFYDPEISMDEKVSKAMQIVSPENKERIRGEVDAYIKGERDAYPQTTAAETDMFSEEIINRIEKNRDILQKKQEELISMQDRSEDIGNELEALSKINMTQSQKDRYRDLVEEGRAIQDKYEQDYDKYKIINKSFLNSVAKLRDAAPNQVEREYMLTEADDQTLAAYVKKVQKETDEAERRGEGYRNSLIGEFMNDQKGTVFALGMLSGIPGASQQFERYNKEKMLFDATVPSNLKKASKADYVDTNIDGKLVEVRVDDDGNFMQAYDDRGFQVDVSDDGIKNFNDSGIGKNAESRISYKSLFRKGKKIGLELLPYFMGGGIGTAAAKAVAKKAIKRYGKKKVLDIASRGGVASVAFGQTIDDNLAEAIKEYGDTGKARNIAIAKSSLTAALTALMPGIERLPMAKKIAVDKAIKAAATKKLPLSQKINNVLKAVGQEYVEEFSDQIGGNAIDIANGLDRALLTEEEAFDVAVLTPLVSTPVSALSEISSTKNAISEGLVLASLDKNFNKQYNDAVDALNESDEVKNERKSIVNNVKKTMDTPVMKRLSEVQKEDVALDIIQQEFLKKQNADPAINEVVKAKNTKKINDLQKKINDAVQEQKPDEVPVQPETRVSEEVEEKAPEARPEKIAPEIAEEVEINVEAIKTNVTPETERLVGLDIEAEDGATLNIDGTKYEQGGLVVPVVSENIKQSELTPERISDFLEKHKDKIGDRDTVKPGLYKFPNQDMVSLDLNIVIPKANREVGLQFGKAAGQESLFDLDTFENVKTGATGESPMSFTPGQFKEIAVALKENRMPDFLSEKIAPETEEEVEVAPEIEKEVKEAQEEAVSKLLAEGNPENELLIVLRAVGYTEDQANGIIKKRKKDIDDSRKMVSEGSSVEEISKALQDKGYDKEDANIIAKGVSTEPDIEVKKKKEKIEEDVVEKQVEKQKKKNENVKSGLTVKRMTQIYNNLKRIYKIPKNKKVNTQQIDKRITFINKKLKSRKPGTENQKALLKEERDFLLQIKKDVSFELATQSKRAELEQAKLEQEQKEQARLEKEEKETQLREMEPTKRGQKRREIQSGDSTTEQLQALLDADFPDITKRVIRAVMRAQKAIAKILPDVNIVVHSDRAVYNRVSGANLGVGMKGTTPKTRAVYNPNTKNVHIYLPNANARTVAHEIFHAIIIEKLKTEGAIQEVTRKMVDDLRRILPKNSKLLKELDAFAENYNENIQNEERIAELFGILSEAYETAGRDAKNIIEEFIKKLKELVVKIAKGLNVDTASLRILNESVEDTPTLLRTLAAKLATGEEIQPEDISFDEVDSEEIGTEQGTEGEVGTVKIPLRQSKITVIESPKVESDPRPWVRRLVEYVNLRELEGKNFVTNMYDYTSAGTTELGNGFNIELLGGRNYVPIIMEKTGKVLGDVSNLAAFNTKAQAEGFIRNSRDGNANLFAPHSGTLKQSWQFQQNIFEQLVDLVLNNQILSKAQLVDTFNDGLKSKGGQRAFQLFNNKNKTNLKNLDSFKSNPKELVRLLNIENNFSPNLRKILNQKIASDKTFQNAIGVKNLNQFYQRIMDPLNKGVVGGEIMTFVEFDPTTFEIKQTKPNDIDHHPSFGWVVKAKINKILQPNLFYKSYDITETYTKYNVEGPSTSRRVAGAEKKFKESNVKSSAGAIPKVAKVEIRQQKETPEQERKRIREKFQAEVTKRIQDKKKRLAKRKKVKRVVKTKLTQAEQKKKAPVIKKIKAILKAKKKKGKTFSGRPTTAGLDAQGQQFFSMADNILGLILNKQDAESKISALRKAKKSVKVQAERLKNIVEKIASITNEVNEQLEFVLEKQARGEELTRKESELIDKAIALDTFGNIESLTLENTEELLEEIKEERRQARIRLDENREAFAKEVKAMQEEAVSQLKKGFGFLFDEDGNPKTENDIKNEKKQIIQNLQRLKITSALKKYFKLWYSMEGAGISQWFRERISHLGTLSNILDVKGKWFTENIYKSLNRMLEAQQKGYFEQIKKLDSIANSIDGITKGYREIRSLMSRGVIEIILKGKKEPFITNNQQLARIYAISKNDFQAARLKEMGFDEEVIENIKNILGPEVVEFVDKTVEYLGDEYFDTVNSVYEKINNVNLGYVENYFPVISENTESDSTMTDDGNFLGLLNIQNQSALKERTATDQEIILDEGFSSALDSYFQSMEKFKSHADGVKKITRALRSPSIQTVLEQTGMKGVFYKGIGAAINPHIFKETNPKLERIIDNFVPAVLAFKIVQIAKQATSFIQAFEDYNFRADGKKSPPGVDLLMYALDTAWVAVTLPYQIKKAYKMSATLKARFAAALQGDVVGLEAGRKTFTSISKSNSLWGKALRAFKILGAAYTVIGDALGVMGYMANYNRNIRNGMSQEKALEAFNDYNATQQTRRDTERSPIQRSNNLLIRAFTSFSSTLFLQMNKVMQSSTNIRRSIGEGKMPLKKDVRALILNYAVANVLFTFMSNLAMFIQGDEEDIEEAMSRLKDAAKGLNILYSLPLIGSASENAIRKSRGERPRMGGGIVNPVDRLFFDVYKGISEKDYEFAVRKTVNIALGTNLDPFAAMYNEFGQDEFNEDFIYEILGISKSYRPKGKKKKSGDNFEESDYIFEDDEFEFEEGEFEFGEEEVEFED